MYYKHAFVIAYIVNVYLVVNNSAHNLSYGHKKRELNFNYYPASSSVANPSQENEINDPGYTRQHENDDDHNTIASERNVSLSSPQNFVEFINPSGQMFHLIYMPSHPHKRQQTPAYQGQGLAYPYNQQLNDNSANVVHAQPHLFPTQLPNKYQNIQQLNLPFRYVNSALQNTYPAQVFLKPYHQNYIQDTKVPTKMEAPFIPSQFLGNSQHQKQQLPPQPQHLLSQQNQQLVQVNNQMPQHQQNQLPQNQLPQQNQLPLQQQQNQLPLQHQQNQLPLQHQQNQLLPQYYQQTLKPAPVHEQHENSPHYFSNLIYMNPNNVYDMYRKSK